MGGLRSTARDTAGALGGLRSAVRDSAVLIPRALLAGGLLLGVVSRLPASAGLGGHGRRPRQGDGGFLGPLDLHSA